MLFFNRPPTESRRGQAAERLATRYLQQRGLKLLECNYHSRFGEIDLIMQEKQANGELTWVFVEVKSRQADAQVSAVEAVSIPKQHRIIKTAEQYLSQFDNLPDCRFDVITITYPANLSPAKLNSKNCIIDWIVAAF